jgi:hypothetical protein
MSSERRLCSKNIKSDQRKEFPKDIFGDRFDASEYYERETRFELATYSLEGYRSTN